VGFFSKLSRKEIKKLWQEGRRCETPYFFLKWLPSISEKPQFRVVIVVKKSLGNAVVRNRLRRLYREALRLCQKQSDSGFDIMLVVKEQSKQATFQQLLEACLKVFKEKML
jgi:ribonuclease P protein component